MATKRNSNIELLRIFSMLFIVFHHFIVHGIEQSFTTQMPNASVHFLASFLASGGKLGVDIFMIISGYFMIRSTFHWSKFFNLLKQMLFYSLLFLGVNCYFHFIPLNALNILQSLLPFTYVGYWFMTCYLVIYLISPYINRLLKNLSYEEYNKFLLLIITLTFILPSVLPNSINILNNQLIILIVCYIIGAYFFLYPQMINKKLTSFLIIFNALFILFSMLGVEVIGRYFHSNAILKHTNFFTADNSIFILGLSMGLVLISIQAKPRHSKVINTISTTTLGIYLIHDNVFVRPTLWEHYLHLNQYTNASPWHLLGFAFLSCISIFLICSLIEWVRLQLFSFIKKLRNAD